MKDGFREPQDLLFEELPRLSFSEIRDKVDDLLVAMANLIDREWPAKYAETTSLKIILLSMVKITENTYRSIRYLCADRPADVNRRMEFAVSVPPLARSILDSIFTIVFIMDDPSNRLEWYYKSGWREAKEEYERHQQAYGSDPDWEVDLASRKAFVDTMQREWNITNIEATDPKKIKWWPNPGGMIRDSSTSEDRRDYLRYLNDWFYRTLSADSHLSWPGLARRASHFLDKNEKERINRIQKYKSDCFVTTMVLVLALLSEIEYEFKFGRTGRLKEVWKTLGDSFLESKELYDIRYANLL